MNWLRQFTNKAQNIIQKFCEAKNETNEQQRHKDEITALKQCVARLDRTLDKLDSSILELNIIYAAFNRIVYKKLAEQGIPISEEELNAERKRYKEEIKNYVIESNTRQIIEILLGASIFKE